MQDAEEPAAAPVDPRDRLARAIVIVKHNSRLIECPTREQIVDARRSGILWVRPRPNMFSPLELRWIAALADNEEDEEIWHRAVQITCPESSALWLKVFRGRRFRLGVEVPVRLGGGWEVWCEGEVQPEELEHDNIESSRRVAAAEVPIRLVVDDDSGYPQLIWRKIRQAVSLQSERKQGGGYRITEIRVCLIQDNWSALCMASAQSCWANGISVVPTYLQASVSLDDTANCLPTLRRLLLGGDDDDDHFDEAAKQRSSSASTVAVFLDSDDQTLDSFFSALMTSPTVREIVVERDERAPGSRVRLWQWLALAFFKSPSTNSLESLKLKSCDLRMREVVELETILNDTNSVATLLLPNQQIDNRRYKSQVASAYEFRLVEPRTGESFKMRSMSSMIFESPVKDMTILESSDEWLTVFLPGWGRAWVARGDAKLSDKPVESTTYHGRKSLRSDRHLTLADVVDQDGHVVRALFEVIGSSIQKLTLEGCRLSDATLQVILRECVNLEELSILDVIDSTLDVITESYERGHCRANQIEIALSRRTSVGENKGLRFFEKLGDAKHELAKNIRVLHFTYVSTDWIEKLQNAILHMLVHNRTLDELYINLRVELQQPNEEPNQELDEAAIAAQAVYPDDGLQPLNPEGSPFRDLNAFDGQELLDAGVLTKRAAFLSVSRSTPDVSNDQLQIMMQLDSNVLSIIFAFAAETHSRFVHIRI